jgi:hypothetical protein
MDNALISIEEIKDYLRIDGEEENALLATLLSVAKEHCENYLQASLPGELPTPVKQAMLILVGHFYEQRVGEPIPEVVYVLLSPYRAYQW